MASSFPDIIDQVQRARASATDLQRAILETKRAIARSQFLLAADADPWPASPERIRQKFGSDAKRG